MVDGMFKFILLLVPIVLLTSCSTSYNSKEVTLKEYNNGLKNGEEPILYPFTVAGIKKIIIRGKSDSKECNDFSLTQNQILGYFNLVNKITSNDYYHMIDWSPCNIYGEIIFNNDTKAKWLIQKYKGGEITFNTGKITYLYCPVCAMK